MTATAQIISKAVNLIALKGVTVSAVSTTVTVSVANLPAVTLTSRWVDWLLPVLVGGGLSLVGSGWATWKTHINAINREETHRKETYRRFIESIRDEIETVFALYMARLGKTLDELKDGDPFIYNGKQDEEYFSVFSSNASHLMLVDDDSLRKQIIRTYAKAKSLKDSISLNNMTLEKFDESEKLKITDNAVARAGFEKRSGDLMVALKAYGNILKSTHDEAKSEAVWWTRNSVPFLRGLSVRLVTSG